MQYKFYFKDITSRRFNFNISLHYFSNCRCMFTLKQEKNYYKIRKKRSYITSKKKEQLLYSCNCNNDLTLVLWMVYYYDYVLLNHNTRPPLQPTPPPPSSMHQPLGLRPWLCVCVGGGGTSPLHSLRITKRHGTFREVGC